MAAEKMFSFKPAEVPPATRGLRRSKYTATIEAVHQYLQDHPDERSVKVELGDVDIKSATTSFRNAIAKQFRDTIRLVQRRGDLYIVRR
jgi:hypothetical protein